jgi:hypothetical protein
MPLLKTRLKLGKLRQVIVLCLVQLSLFFGLAISDFSNVAALAAPLQPEATSYQIAQVSSELNLEKAANKASEASEKIFEGKDKTKSVFGGSEKSDRAIEEGREKASEKWQSLADKAQRVQDSDESLTVPEAVVLKNIQPKD